MKTDLPYWLQGIIITGREEGDDENDEGNESDEDELDEDENEEGSSIDENDTEALKKALEEERKGRREERRARRKAERAIKTAQTQKSNEEEAKELEEANRKLADAQDKASKMAARMLKNEIRTAVINEATRQKFIDPTDALIADVLDEIDADQDDNDPSDIDIDLDSVKDAVKALAEKKKHLIGKPNEGEPSGGKFKDKGNKKNEVQEQKLQELYPSLG